MKNKKTNLHLHIVRKMDVSKTEKIINKIATIITAFILSAFICELFSPGSFAGFFKYTFVETFQNPFQVFNIFKKTAILLGISLALLPAFKMRFWNLGAEGQVVLGGFGAALVSKYIGPNVSNFTCIILMILAAIILGSFWSLIPAIFKAKFNTNETLFTLMFNYIAMGLVSAAAHLIDKSHGLINGLTHGMIIESTIFGMEYIVPIVVVLVLFVVMVIYLKKSKHGYELSVVGENINTARYVGIKVEKVILRTVILSGAICGLIGFLLVSLSGQVAANIAGGNGFTAVLVVWLGHFNPFDIALSSLLLNFLNNGADNAQSAFNLGSSFPSVCLGIFFFTILVGEFFINYKIIIGKKNKESKKGDK